jgi:hypothetical protein
MVAWRRRGDVVDGPGMSRVILSAQTYGQLDKRRLHSNVCTWSLKEMVWRKLGERSISVDMWLENNTVEGTFLAIWKCCNIIVNPAKKSTLKYCVNYRRQ